MALGDAALPERWIPVSWGRAATVALVTALAIGIPTVIIPNPVFGREIPVRWWEYPVFALTVLLTAAWFGIQTKPTDKSSGALPTTGAVMAFLAVGCPVCNKLVIAAIGVSGALGFWAPLQPLIAVASLVLMAAAVAYRWRRRDCGGVDGTCGVSQPDAGITVSQPASS